MLRILNARSLRELRPRFEVELSFVCVGVTEPDGKGTGGQPIDSPRQQNSRSIGNRCSDRISKCDSDPAK